MPNKVAAIIGVLVFAIALVTAVAVFGTFATTAYSINDDTNAGERVQYDAARLQGTNSFVPYNDGRGTKETVYKTTGFAVEFSGQSESYATSDADINITEDGQFSISTWASVNQSSTGEYMTVFAVGGEIVIQYLDGTWSGWYYDAGSTNSYRVNISAPNPTGRTLITVSNNQTHLTIYRNTTQGDTVDSTASSIEKADLNTSNFHGTLEESRGFDEPTNDSQQSELYNNPIAAQNNRNRSYRIMWDQPGRNQILLFTSTNVDVNNGEFVDGFDQQKMQSRSALVGSDYAWDNEGPQIRPLSGGELDGFPVAYADYKYTTLLSDQVDGVAKAYRLAALIPILLVSLLVVGVVRKFGG